MLTDEMRFRLLRLLEANPSMSQREIAQELGVSLGRVNFCLNALIEKGFVKAKNFKRQKKKMRYVYLITPTGIEEKAAMTVRFLRMKIREYEALKAEIVDLQNEAQSPEKRSDRQ